MTGVWAFQHFSKPWVRINAIIFRETVNRETVFRQLTNAISAMPLKQSISCSFFQGKTSVLDVADILIFVISWFALRNSVDQFIFETSCAGWLGPIQVLITSSKYRPCTESRLNHANICRFYETRIQRIMRIIKHLFNNCSRYVTTSNVQLN